ncbi:MAG: MarR family transcriptional regulator [Lachnospiraceae bacterium]|nr:MarR family transcriptional regulator [Lachnospiraceae bacterium]
MESTFTPEELRMMIRKLSYTDRLHHSCIEKNVQELGIHRNQHMILMYLSNNEVESQKAIAEKFNISTAAVATTLKTLEKNGYIMRAACEDDTRKNNIAITEKGIAVIETSKKKFDIVDKEMVKGISREQFDTFCEILELFQNNLIELESNNNFKS